MPERIFVMGNEAVGWGALAAGCEGFFGYPITPQNEATEWFAREFPARGRVFIQTSSETASINWLYGGAAIGARVITSTSSPGWSLMQETLSHMANTELPCVVSLVQRGGPGQGTTRHAQMDYSSATRGGCHGGYRNIVLAPASVQEVHDLVQLAFHLADKYRNPVILLSDGIIGTMIEPLELRTLEFDPLPEKDWALRGKARQKDGKRRLLTPGQGLIPTPRNPSYGALLQNLHDKFQQMKAQEVRYESILVEDVDLILVAYGYGARVCQEAMGWARKEGFKVGMIRPITVWPFPTEVVRAQVERGARFLVVEDSLGQMVADVEEAVQGRSEIQLVSALERHESMEGGAIYPEKVLERIKKMLAA